MPLTEKSRLEEIAAQTLKAWIEQQILETSEPPATKACEDHVQCVVEKAIDWRRDYISALNLARSFSTVQEYDDTLARFQQRANEIESRSMKNFQNMATATNAEDFNDAAHDFLSPMTLQAQIIFLGKIRRVFMYLHGTMTAPDDFKHIRPNAQGNTQHLFTIMQDQGTFDEWKTLIDKIPAAKVTAYRQHLGGIQLV